VKGGSSCFKSFRGDKIAVLRGIASSRGEGCCRAVACFGPVRLSRGGEMILIRMFAACDGLVWLARGTRGGTSRGLLGNALRVLRGGRGGPRGESGLPRKEIHLR